MCDRPDPSPPCSSAPVIVVAQSLTVSLRRTDTGGRTDITLRTARRIDRPVAGRAPPIRARAERSQRLHRVARHQICRPPPHRRRQRPAVGRAPTKAPAESEGRVGGPTAAIPLPHGLVDRELDPQPAIPRFRNPAIPRCRHAWQFRPRLAVAARRKSPATSRYRPVLIMLGCNRFR